MALTRITKGVIKPNENYDTHNINSTGIVTAIGLDVNGSGDISGNLSVGGVLTYEDVTSIDSVGIITARNGIDCNGDIDVDGHTNLDNVSIAGITTMSGNLRLESTYPRIYLKDTNHNPDFSIINNDGKLGFYDDTNATYRLQILGTGETKVYHNLIVDKDIDVDGHTNLDNVSVSGVTTAANHIKINDDKFLALGNNQDFRIYHNSSNSFNFIQPHNNGPLLFKGASALMAKFEPGATSILYFNNAEKIKTTNTGVTVTGIITTTDLDVDGHTNLDNVSVAGVSTFSGDVHIGSAVLTNPAGTTVDFNGSITASDVVTAGALLHEGDTNTLVHFSAADTIQLKTGGSSRLLINNSGLNLENGYFNSNGNRIILGDSSGVNDDRLVLGNTNDLQLYHNASDSYIENATGVLKILGDIIQLGEGSDKVGINQNNPTFTLDVNGEARINNNLVISTGNKLYTKNSQGQLTIMGGATYPGSAIKFAGGQSGATDRGTMIFYAGTATSLEEKFRITPVGNVVVGSTGGVAGRLEVNQGSSINGATEYDGQNFAINIRANRGANPNDEGNGICFSQLYYTSSGSRIRTGGIVGYKISGNGSFGGGLKFKVQKAGASPMLDIVRMRETMVEIPHDNVPLQFGIDGDFKIYHNGSHNYLMASNGDYVFDTGSAELVRITSGGHMGLGDNAPAAFTNYTNFSIHGASGGAITFGDDGTDEWEIYGGDGSLRVYDRTNSTERLRITDGGRVGINKGGNPGHILDVYNEDGSDCLRLDTNASAAGSSKQNAIRFSTSGTVRAHVGVAVDAGRLMQHSVSNDFCVKTNTAGSKILVGAEGNEIFRISKELVQTRTLSGGYYPVVSARDGSSSVRAATSAWEIKKTLGPAAKTGYYYLKNPYDGTTSQWWCDMTTDGGGWILIAHTGEGQMAAQSTSGDHWWDRHNKGGFDSVGSGYYQGGGYWRQSNGNWGENTCGQLMWDVRVHNQFGFAQYGYHDTADSNSKVVFNWGTDQALPSGNSGLSNIPNANNRRFNDWCYEVLNAPGFNPSNYHQNIRSNTINGANYFTEHMVMTWSFRNTSGAGDAGTDGPYWMIGSHHDGLHQHYEESLSGNPQGVYGHGGYQVVSNQDTYWANNPGGTNNGMRRLAKIDDSGTVNIWLR